MCVLTFIPTANSGYILSSNRDESTTRTQAIKPQKYIITGKEVYFPKDPQGGGTWLATSEGLTLCLLNGGLEKHTHYPPYKHSRGLVVLDFFSFEDLSSFIEKYDFDGIEPFTLIIFNKKENLEITEIRWTGKELLVKKIENNLPQIWSSVTLYSPEVIAKRAEWFKVFLEENDNPDPEEIIDFHFWGGKEDIENGINMNRNESLKTISISQIIVSETQTEITYNDLLTQQLDKLSVFHDLKVHRK